MSDKSNHSILDKISLLKERLSQILIGKEEVIERIIAVLFSGGNILFEDFPGVGKTVISKALAHLIQKEDGQNIRFTRIQGTPDLLPYDITGVDIYNPQKNAFLFHPGPIFTDILLADELNRATPKVQSALLEAMAEKQVTVGTTTHYLSKLFMVIATQNPIEMEGTYPLPAAQLDRFSCRIQIGYPIASEEMKILKGGRSEQNLSHLKPVLVTTEILSFREKLSEIIFHPSLDKALINLANKTRCSRELKNGLSTRALLSMKETAKSYAAIKNRNYVTDQDLMDLADNAFTHRLLPVHPKICVKELVEQLLREEIRKIIQT